VNIKKDKEINWFVKACRLYNKGLGCQKYILKLIEMHVPHLSLSKFADKIPDKAQSGNFTAIWLQKAIIATMNRIAGKHLIMNGMTDQLKQKIIDNYVEMINSFDECQNVLIQNFSVDYDTETKNLIQQDGKRVPHSHRAKISYFSDFIFIQ